MRTLLRFWAGLVVLILVSAAAAQAAPAQPPAPAATYATETDLPYYDTAALAQDDDRRALCKLDLYYPENHTGFATVVWFHGGGLTGGKRSIPAGLKNRGYAVAAVSYRFAPPGKFPCFLEDAAASTASVMRLIVAKGGDPKKVFVSGHSAGGYLAAMIGLDPRWLAAHRVSSRDLAGIIPISGQMTTHFQVRKVRGDTSPALRPAIDEFAPIYHATERDAPPVCLIVGDRAIEYKSRVEENAFMAVTLKNLGHPRVEFHEMGGLDHRSVGEGGIVVARAFIDKLIAPAKR